MLFKKKKSTNAPEAAVQASAEKPVAVSADRIHGLLAETVDLKAFNITVGGDGSVEIMKDSVIIKDTRMPVEKGRFMFDAIAWLRQVTGDRVPNGLRLDEEFIDLDGSVYTFPIDGKKLDIEGIRHVDVGIYGRQVSPEAACKDCYIVFKPSYDQ